MMNKLQNRKAFTLVELLIVIIIIAVLAAIAIPKFANSSQKSKDSALRSELTLARNAIELFKNDTGCYPQNLTDLTVEVAPTNGINKDTSGCTLKPGFNGPYLSKKSVDPTNGNDLTYPTSSKAVVTSGNTGSGADGVLYSNY